MTSSPRPAFIVHRDPINAHGRIIVVSGPSGVGKGTVIRRVLTRITDLALSVSATTRPMRDGDKDGETYHFLSQEAFEAGIKDGIFYEWARYKHNYYGTLKRTVQEKTATGQDIILEIDIQGARQVKELAPHAVLVYIQPPDFETLERRLRGRATENEEAITERLAAAIVEQSSVEADYAGHYVITNDNLDACTDLLCTIIQAERHRLIRPQPEG
jgi:guanylate kinase